MSFSIHAFSLSIPWPRNLDLFISHCLLSFLLWMFVISYCQRNASCYRQNRDLHHSASQRCSPIRDESSFQTTFHIPATHMHSTALSPSARKSERSLPRPPPAWTSSHHWYRHRHRASNERRAVRRVADWLNHEAAVLPPSELDRRHDVLILHEHCSHRYYLHPEY